MATSQHAQWHQKVVSDSVTWYRGVAIETIPTKAIMSAVEMITKATGAMAAEVAAKARRTNDMLPVSVRHQDLVSAEDRQ